MFNVKIIQGYFKDVLFWVFPGRQISLKNKKIKKSIKLDKQFEIQQTQIIIIISVDWFNSKVVQGNFVLYIWTIVFKFKSCYLISILHSHKKTY